MSDTQAAVGVSSSRHVSDCELFGHHLAAPWYHPCLASDGRGNSEELGPEPFAFQAQRATFDSTTHKTLHRLFGEIASVRVHAQ